MLSSNFFLWTLDRLLCRYFILSLYLLLCLNGFSNLKLFFAIILLLSACIWIITLHLSILIYNNSSSNFIIFSMNLNNSHSQRALKLGVGSLRMISKLTQLPQTLFTSINKFYMKFLDFLIILLSILNCDIRLFILSFL